MNQRGFIQLPLMAWGAIAAGAVILALSGAVYVQTVRLNATKAEFATFRGGVEALGRKAQADKIAKEAADKSRKETADAEHSAALAALSSTVAKLRARPGSGRLPPAPVCPGDPAGADRYRSESERAYRDLVAGLREEADRSSKAVIGLNSAKRWAQKP
jgi:hypothetical protein